MFKKVFTAILCLAVAISAVGCKSGKIGNSESDLEISLLRCGLGREFLDNILAAYGKDHPEVNFSVDSSAEAGIFGTTIDAGAKNNTVDIYFTTEPMYFKMLADGSENIADLTDVYRTQAEGESKTIEQKMPQMVRDNFSYQGKYYALPWQSLASGLVYNATLFSQKGYEIPRTTVELADLVERIYADEGPNGVSPVIHNMNGYWNTVIEAWWAQYEGVDGYNDFWRAKDGDNQPSVNVFSQQGRLEALKALEQVIAPSGHLYPGSNSLSHTFSQTLFLNGSAYMMPNGGWLQSEMKNEFTGKYDFKFMKTPILSSLGAKLGISETQLRDVVDYIDGKLPSCTVDEDIVDRVRDARNVVHSVGFHCQVFVPEYSSAKETAKDFLKFMYSDAGIRIYLDTLHFMPPVSFSDKTTDDIDTAGYSTFEISQLERQKTAEYVVALYDYPLFYAGGALSWYSAPELLISATNPDDRKTAQVFFEENETNAAENWDRYLTLSRLKK